MNKRIKKFTALFMTTCMLLTYAFTDVGFGYIEAEAATTDTIQSDALLDELMNNYTSFILVRHRSLGASHYAYTEGLSDELENPGAPDGIESNFYPGSQLVRIDLEKDGGNVRRTETVLIESNDGVIRDPDVSADGTKALFSWKKSRADDFHLYEYDLRTGETKQLTFGSGIADFEPKYLANGKIVFSSSRIIQTIDCWKTPVSNIFICDGDGSNITRLGQDQVHTTYPTVTSDGRVIYTRWDYNDRTQMFVQGLFQMFPDGTNQTELFGNNSNFPTTLMHTREIPGTSDKYISIASGHHTYQAGKLCVVDTSKGRNSKDSVQFVVEDNDTKKNDSVDGFGQNGAIYKYPYAINENLFMVAYCESGWAGDKTHTPFGIYLFDMNGHKKEVVAGNEAMPPSQIVPIAQRTMFERASMVNYTSETGTYYMADVYAGDGLKGIDRGTAKYLRVVALDYRPYSIGATIGRGVGSSDPYSPIATGNGAWDVKRVLGVTPIQEDGSALFKIPADTPIYFQVLDSEGCVIQSMRSWSTLMPGETFSCVGCHEDKNTVPKANSTTTIAMAKGVQELQPDIWQTGSGYEDYDPYHDSKGFDYLEEIQPIWDESCVECHSDLELAYEAVDAYSMRDADTAIKSTPLALDAKWRYSTEEQNGDNWIQEDFDDSSWARSEAPFGTATSGPGQIGTVWNSDRIYMRNRFKLNKYEYGKLSLSLNLACINAPQIYINGQLVYQSSESISSYRSIAVTSAMKKAMRVGTNTIAIVATKSPDQGNFVGLSVEARKTGNDNVDVMVPANSQWRYKTSNDNNVENDWKNIDFNDSGWNTNTAPFGDRDGYATRCDENRIWMRKTFTINNLADYAGCAISLNTYYDDHAKYYLNGQLIFEDSGWVDDYTLRGLGTKYSKYLVQGTNVLSVEIANDGGGKIIDCELSLRKVRKEETGLVFTQSEWKYMTSANDNIDGAWNRVGFDDGNWKTAQAPFGDRDGSATSWSGDDTYIWMRNSFDIDDLSEFNNCSIRLDAFYDDHPEIYLNGNLIYANDGWTDQYTSISLDQSYTNNLVQGTNVLAVKCKNDGGGRIIDVGLAMSKGSSPYIELLPKRSTDWKYVIGGKPSNDWMNEGYDDSSWNNGNAPFGNLGECTTRWDGDNTDIWLRKNITINNINDIKNMKMIFDIFYDEDPTVYINGTEVFSANGYQSEYITSELASEFTNLFKQGTNVLAIHTHNGVGGAMIDLGISLKSTSDIPMSLASTEVLGYRMKRTFPISYLVLTGSYPNGENWIANATGQYVNWISSMSQCEMLNPYQYGSKKSTLIRMLRNGHGNLSDEEIRRVEAWIDLGVPACGTYDAHNAWDGNAVRWKEQYVNKRELYESMDEYAKANRAGVINDQPINITYEGKNGRRYEVSQSGMATLYIDKNYEADEKVTIRLPEGEKYAMVCLNSMIGEELIYVPNGVFTYTIPNATNVFPNTWRNAITNTITARLPKESELTTKRNLAENAYDLDDANNAYPHATAKSAYGDGGRAEFLERNAIDGFTANTGHGDYPYQSWGPKNDDGLQWMKVDFGREVYANEVEVYIRADFPHDTHYVSAKLEFSDGTEKEITMKQKKEAQVYKFDTVKTSSVTIKDLVPSDGSTNLWEGIIELKVNGTVNEPKVPEKPDNNDDEIEYQPGEPTGEPNDNNTEIVDPNTPGVPQTDPNTPGVPQTDPNVPGDTQTDPNTPGAPQTDPNVPGDTQTDPNTPGVPQTDPNVPGDTQTDPSVPGGTQTDPNTPGVPQTDPNVPGGTQTDPNVPGGIQTDPNTSGGTQTNPSVPNTSNGTQTNPNTPSGTQTDPNVPGGTQTNPNVPNTSNGTQIDLNESGGVQIDPGVPGGVQIDPSVPGGVQIDPNVPGGVQIDPNTPGGVQIDPNASNGISGTEVQQTASDLGITSEGVTQAVEIAQKYNGSIDTLHVTQQALTTRKSDSDVKGSSYSLLLARAVKQTKSSIKLQWKRIKDADGYMIYGNKCGKKNSFKLIKTIENGSKTTFTHKKLNKGTYYKYMVCAYKIVDGQKVTIVASKTIHAPTAGGKYGVAKSISVKPSSVKLKVKKSKKLSAKEVVGKKPIQKLCYESTDTSVATVSNSGKIVAKKKGKCYVYIYAQNGSYKKVKVTVK